MYRLYVFETLFNATCFTCILYILPTEKFQRPQLSWNCTVYIENLCRIQSHCARKWGFLYLWICFDRIGIAESFSVYTILSSSKKTHSPTKCWQVGSTVYWLKAALFAWGIYVPVNSLHLICAILLSWILSLTMELLPTFNTFVFRYFVDDLLFALNIGLPRSFYHIVTFVVKCKFPGSLFRSSKIDGNIYCAKMNLIWVKILSLGDSLIINCLWVICILLSLDFW